MAGGPAPTLAQVLRVVPDVSRPLLPAYGDSRHSAVLVLLTDVGDGPEVLLTAAVVGDAQPSRRGQLPRWSDGPGRDGASTPRCAKHTRRSGSSPTLVTMRGELAAPQYRGHPQLHRPQGRHGHRAARPQGADVGGRPRALGAARRLHPRRAPTAANSGASRRSTGCCTSSSSTTKRCGGRRRASSPTSSTEPSPDSAGGEAGETRRARRGGRLRSADAIVRAGTSRRTSWCDGREGSARSRPDPAVHGCGVRTGVDRGQQRIAAVALRCRRQRRPHARGCGRHASVRRERWCGPHRPGRGSSPCTGSTRPPRARRRAAPSARRCEARLGCDTDDERTVDAGAEQQLARVRIRRW